jgi:DNA-binding CsgD family transcriptional regulator
MEKNLEDLLVLSSQFKVSEICFFEYAEDISYFCNLCSGLLKTGRRFPKQIILPVNANHISHLYTLVHPLDRMKIWDATGILFNMILEKGLSKSDAYYVVMRIKSGSNFSWYLRTSRPSADKFGEPCNISQLTCLDGIYVKQYPTFGWIGKNFSNEEFLMKLKEKWSRSVFTETEIKILDLSVSGLKFAEIALKMNCKSSTVKTHFQNMRRKTCSRNRIELHNYYRSLCDISIF